MVAAMTDFYATPLSQEEYDATALVLAERMKNVIYATCLENAKKTFKLVGIQPGESLEYCRATDKITIAFSIEFVFNDFTEVVAGLRREG